MTEKKQVELLRDLSQMTADNRIRYYMGLPQEYPMSPVLIAKGLERLAGAEIDEQRRLTDFEQHVRRDLTSAKRAFYQDERQFAPHEREGVKRRRQRYMDYDVRGSTEPWGTREKQARGMERGVIPMMSALKYLPRAIGSVTGDHPSTFPSQEAAAAHLRRRGFRDPGESVSQAKTRKKVAKGKVASIKDSKKKVN
tara:strand:- start:1160 stop:1747 length:588 start_codon:yes stop_codon:yes gene_type:complete